SGNQSTHWFTTAASGQVSGQNHPWRNGTLSATPREVTMLIIVTYDVSTETRAGRRRLRRVAKVCESMGQRVQKSVFECRVDRMQLEQLEHRLLAEIDEEEDNLRLYRLTGPVDLHVREYGKFKAINFEEPLIN